MKHLASKRSTGRWQDMQLHARQNKNITISAISSCKSSNTLKRLGTGIRAGFFLGLGFVSGITAFPRTAPGRETSACIAQLKEPGFPFTGRPSPFPPVLRGEHQCTLQKSIDLDSERAQTQWQLQNSPRCCEPPRLQARHPRSSTCRYQILVHDLSTSVTRVAHSPPLQLPIKINRVCGQHFDSCCCKHKIAI